jgi:Papain family cysteine protease
MLQLSYLHKLKDYLEVHQPLKQSSIFVFMLFYSIAGFSQGCLFDPVAAAKQPIKKFKEHLGAKHRTFSLKKMNRCPEVGDQKSCKSCVAWAMGYYAFSILKDSTNEPYSPYFICEKTKNCGDGMYVEDGYAVLNQYKWGIPRFKNSKPNCDITTAVQPLTPTMEKLYQYDLNKSDNERFQEVELLMASIQSSIVNINKPKSVILIMRYHPKLHSPQMIGQGEEAAIRPFDELKTTTEYHAVCVVGYNYTRMGNDYLEIVNSWGTNWGNNGYAKIKREHFDSIIMAVYAFSVL